VVEQFMLTVDGVPYSVEIKGNQITVNGYALTLGSQEGEGDEPLLIDGVAHTVELMGNQAIVDGIGYGFEVEWPADEAEVTVSRGSRPGGAAAGAVGGKGAITAIMPGRVVRVLVQEGDAVRRGQVLAILEAMKMENELTAPTDGVVKRVLVSPGGNVELGQPLIEID
jgi:glutaconyl-CoA/methylmalonyl-CoA decarboxylase subunit gamma